MKIYTDTPEGTTVIQNAFIDQYMPHANGEFVKVYLYLLRCANTGRDLSLASIADVFEHTEKDIQRALVYWEKQNLLRLKLAQDGTLLMVTFTDAAQAARNSTSPSTVYSGQGASIPSGSYSSQGAALSSGVYSGQGAPIPSGSYSGQGSPIPSGSYSGQKATAQQGAFSGQGTDTYQELNKPNRYNAGSISKGTATPQRPTCSASDSESLPPERLASLKEQKNLRQLFFIAEQYLQRPLTSTEQNDFLYYYDTLHFSTDLIEYLLEYCISKGSASRHYMRKVALAWAEAGITTVLQAKQESNLYNKNYFTIMNAFGIKGRNPAAVEQELMSRWLNEFGFPIDIILNACERTIRQTHQPNFQYTDKILEQWHNSGVKSLADVQKLDLQRLQEQKRAAARPQKSAGNRFNNFSQREYDYNQLEKQLLNQ